MKKLFSLALVFTMVLAFAVPALAATADFIGGTVAAIDKNGYDSFNGTEITANNSVTQFDSFSLVADNKTLNAWYIDVTDDISGTLEVAYKVGGAYYVVTFDIDGAGKYRIADSKGSAGTNMVKVGAFEETEDVKYGVLDVYTHWWLKSYTQYNTDEMYALFDEIYQSGAFDFGVHFTNGYGDYDCYELGFNAHLPYDNFYVPIGELIEFKLDPSNGSFEYDGYIYTWCIDELYGQMNAINDTLDGAYFVAGSDLGFGGVPEEPYIWTIELIFQLLLDRVPIQ